MLLNGNMDIIFIHIYLRNMVYDVKLAVKLKKLKSSFLYRIFPFTSTKLRMWFQYLANCIQLVLFKLRYYKERPIRISGKHVFYVIHFQLLSQKPQYVNWRYELFANTICNQAWRFSMISMFRSSRSLMFFKISVLKNYENLTGKRLCLSLF